jgi:hypothetical protein
MSNSEYEDQQEANRIIDAFGGLGAARAERSKYESYQPSVTQIQSRQMTENLIVKGHILLRVEDSTQGGFSFVFAGKQPAETAKLIATGKLTLDDNNPQGRKRAQERIQEVILDYKSKQNR